MYYIHVYKYLYMNMCYIYLYVYVSPPLSLSRCTFLHESIDQWANECMTNVK